jgi:hypothetical protein
MLAARDPRSSTEDVLSRVPWQPGGGRALRRQRRLVSVGCEQRGDSRTLHFTPTSGSWLNMVEIFFGIITRQAIRRGTFTSVK